MRRVADFVLWGYPVQVLAVVLAVGVAVPVSTPYVLFALVPLYGLGYRRLRDGVLGSGAIVVAQVASMDNVLEPISAVVLCAGVVGAARFVLLRRQSGERERELLAEASATEERLRIARELHDAVGHDVSLMVVQAEALAAVTGDERADEIAALGRRTMGELHRTLKLLRDDDAQRAPQPGLGALDTVIDGARAAGVPITLAVEGAPRPLAPGLDASAYRIVQEAVTNVIRHAGGAAASVTVRYGDETLELEVADEGDGTTSNGGGHGLVGMRERVAAFGGELEVGPRPGHGFRVHAELPYAA
jgi:signal transduction histidine kinase